MKEKDRIHFIGIGGVGMSGLAEVFHCHGYYVQGSDIKKTKITGRLEAMGIRVKEGHSAKNIEGADYVVYSSCITEDNVEIKEARQKKIPILKRIEAFNMLLGDKKIVAVSGAHGKTTTTALVSYLLIKQGLDPTVFIGADAYFLGRNARYGKSDIVITEADESDGSFLFLKPLYSVSTNIDREHMDYYSSMDNVAGAYKRFIDNTEDEGCAFACGDDDNLRLIVKDSHRNIIWYGFSQDADLRAERIKSSGLRGSSFDVVFRNKNMGRIDISIIGIHNILNSLPAIGIALELGMDFSSIRKAIVDFKGADRRFVVTHLRSGTLLIDDYAHHPTEIKATLKVLEGSGRRIVVVFQPHRYSRTKDLKKEFGASFDLADYLAITDIYPAYERPIQGVSSQDLCESIKMRGHKDVHFVPRDAIVRRLREVVRPGDAVFILGAGDIGELPESIARSLEATLKR